LKALLNVKSNKEDVKKEEVVKECEEEGNEICKYRKKSIKMSIMLSKKIYYNDNKFLLFIFQILFSKHLKKYQQKLFFHHTNFFQYLMRYSI